MNHSCCERSCAHGASSPAGEETLAKADELARSIEDSLFGDLPADARDRLNQTLRAGLTRSAAD